MRVATLLRRLPWVASLLVGCGDDSASVGGSESSTSEAMASTTGDTTTDDTGTTQSNAAPTAVDDVVFTAQDAALVLNAANGLLGNDTDPDGDPLTVTSHSLVSAGGGDVVIADDGAAQYNPGKGFWGTDSFEYTIEDDTGAAATATVTVYVAPAQIPLSEVTAGMGGFVLEGRTAGDQSGRSVSRAGDVNGDGMDDIILGIPYANANGYRSGRSYVVFGKSDTTAVELSAIAAGTGGFFLEGETAEDFSGRSVSAAGDVNGDGLDDIIVGAYLADASPFRVSSGRSYVVFGKADTNGLDLSRITEGVGGFMIAGEGSEDFSGRSVSGAGDINGDGMDDIIIGADYSGNRSGRSYVVFGKSDTATVELFTITGAEMGGFFLEGEAEGDQSGYSVSGAGDVNGDGMDDIIVGAAHAAPNGDESGRSYVVFGKADTAPVELSVITAGTGGFVLEGEAAFDQSGGSVSGAGDVNGDGMDDIILGASFADIMGANSGRSYVVFGKTDTAAVELSDITSGVGGFVLNGEAPGDRAGGSVSGAGDVNGDGMDDIIVGASFASSPNDSYSGRSYVVFGKADTAAVELSALKDGMGGFVLHGEAASDFSGGSVSGAGDVNNDGIDDVIIGAVGADIIGDNSGRSYVVFGVPTGEN